MFYAKGLELKLLYGPMDFFGFGNKTGIGWFKFIKQVPGLKMKGKKKILYQMATVTKMATVRRNVFTKFSIPHCWRKIARKVPLYPSQNIERCFCLSAVR